MTLEYVKIAQKLINSFKVRKMSSVQEKIDKAKSLLGENKVTEAEKQLKEAVELDNTSVEALVELTRLFALMQKWEDYDKTLDQALQLSQDNADVLTFKGISLSRKGNLQEAIDYYKKALAINPDLVMTLTNLGAALRETGELTASEETLSKGIKLEPKNFHLHYELAQTLAYQMRVESAIYEVVETLKLNPRYERAYLALAKLYQQGKQVDQAIKILQECLTNVPNSWTAVEMLTNFYMLKGDFKSAFDIWEQITTQRGTLDDYLQLSRICLTAGNLQKAEQVLSHAARKNPNSWEVQYCLGEFYDVAGLIDKAQEKYKTAIRLNKTVYPPYNNLGLLLLKKGDVQSAIHQFSQACKLAPAGEPKPAYNLALAFCQAKKHTEAKGLLEIALEGSPTGAIYDEMRRLLQAVEKELTGSVEDYVN